MRHIFRINAKVRGVLRTGGETAIVWCHSSVLDWWNGYARTEQGSDGLPLFGLLADMADIIFRLTIAASSAGAQFDCTISTRVATTLRVVCLCRDELVGSCSGHFEGTQPPRTQPIDQTRLHQDESPHSQQSCVAGEDANRHQGNASEQLPPRKPEAAHRLPTP